MPCRLLVQVVEARALPVMDSRSDLTDAYVELKVAELPTQKTEIKKKTLNPVWNQTFCFEILMPRRLQDLPIELKVYDHDVMSKDDIIGIVSIDCSLLMTSDSPQISGWFPIHDTMRGIRGELSVIIHIEQISNVNQYKDSSTGMFVCSSPNPEPAYIITHIIGFVEELRVNTDPEYSVKDRIRASRVSNNDRKHTIDKLMGKIKRKIGIKVRRLGGNAIIGYRQHVDLEERSRLVVLRAYGTACTLVRNTGEFIKMAPGAFLSHPSAELPDISLSMTDEFENEPLKPLNQSTAPKIPVEILTVDSLPQRVLVNQAGLVMSRSIKEIKDLGSKQKKIENKRDKWWNELRNQIRGHAAALSCNSILGYSETVCILDGVIVLTGLGTAAYITPQGSLFDNGECRDCHLPVTFASKITEGGGGVACKICKEKFVSDFLISTLEPVDGLPVYGEGCFIQARVCRPLPDTEVEDFSEIIPLLDFEAHQELINQMKLLGVNSIFSLRHQLKFSENGIFALLTGTGLLLASHPLPDLPSLSSSLSNSKGYEIKRRGSAIDVPSIQPGALVLDELRKKAEGYRQLDTLPPHPFSEHIKDSIGFPDYGIETLEPPFLPVFSEDQIDGTEALLEMISAQTTTKIVDLNQPIYEDSASNVLQLVAQTDGLKLFTTQHLPTSMQNFGSLRSIALLVQMQLETTSGMGSKFSYLFDCLCQRIRYHLFLTSAVAVTSLNIEMDCLEDVVQFLCTGMAVQSSCLSPGCATDGSPTDPFVLSPYSPPMDNLDPSQMSKSLNELDSLYKKKEPHQQDTDKSPVGSPTPSPTQQRHHHHHQQQQQSVLSSPLKSSPRPIILPHPHPHQQATTTTTTTSINKHHQSSTTTPTYLLGGCSPASSPPPLSLNQFLADHPDFEIDEANSSELSETFSGSSLFPTVTLSHMNFIPNTIVDFFIGRVHINVIREKTGINEEGFSTFVHHCMAECQSVARANVAGVGANALVSLRYDLVHVKTCDGSKTGYAMISMSGDALKVRPVQRYNPKLKPRAKFSQTCVNFAK